jgi:hypothetical protein
LAVGFFAAACLASWCMPTPKQMEKLANAAAFRKNVPPVGTPGPGDDEMPPEYWQAVMDDPRADAGRRTTGPSIRTLRLSEFRDTAAVTYRRCVAVWTAGIIGSL